MFRPRNQLSSAQPSTVLLAKPLLHVLEPNQTPDDFIRERLQGHRQMALKGETDVILPRAELELKKAMRSLDLLSNTTTNSFPTLTALSLPGMATALFWTIHALLDQTHQKPNLANPIRSLNHDAHLLFQQLSQLDLIPWYTQSIDKVPPKARFSGIQFPPGHPIPGGMYRKHAIQAKHNYYYPVTHYFSLLFEERKQALIELLADLGATKIVIETRSPATADAHHQEVFEYAPRTHRATGIEPQQYPWLAYEPVWQSVVNERLKRGLTSTQFEFDLDVMGLLRTQVQTIVQLIPELDSMQLPPDHEAKLLTQALHTRRVQVEFGPLS